MQYTNKNIILVVIITYVWIHPMLALSLLPAEAIIISPIVDAYTIPLSSAHIVPLECKKAAHCPRIAQLLFHERVTVTKESDKYVQIQVPHFFYITREQPTQAHRTCWIPKKSFIFLAELSPEERLKLPSPFHPQLPLHNNNAPSVATLVKPWYHPKNKTWYSVGTRFIIKQSTKNAYIVYILDHHHKKITTIEIPKYVCIDIPHHATNKARQNAYVELVRSWIQETEGIIPYVWGGCSLTSSCKDPLFNFVPDKKNLESFITRPACKDVPFSGFDCAGLILRAAQCCSIPYFFKNSTTVAHYLRPLQESEEVEPGDIIWIYGHVMIADPRYNTLLEARSHYHGYGKVQEIPLHQEFKNIYTFKDLTTAFFKAQALERLDATGDIVQKIPNFKILKFSSLYEPSPQ